VQVISHYDFHVFEATPGKRVIFLPDAPEFTIVAASQEMREFVGRTREQMIGKSVFEAFPANPADLHFTGHNNLRAALEYVVRHKTSHQMESQRYDVASEGGSFREIYWQNTSTPVCSEEGKVIYIIHTAEDITEKVKAKELREQIKGLEQAYYVFLQAPTVISIMRGKTMCLCSQTMPL
jgi:PAS domain S-box-containing protein